LIEGLPQTMMLSRSPLLALLVISLLISAVQCSPPIGTRDHAKTSKKIGTGNHSKTLKKQTHYQKYKKEKELPDNVDVDTISLKDLVEMRPGRLNSPEGKRYRDYFTRHPEVKKINLHDTDSAKTIKSLAELSKLHTDSPWKGRMAASVRNLINDAPITDKAQKAKLKELVVGVRHKANRRDGHQRYSDKLGKEVVNARKRKAEVDYENRNGFGYSEKRRLIRKVNPLLDLPLKHHIDDKGKGWMTMYEIEKEVKKLAPLYTSQAILTKELKRYMKGKDVPPQEMDAIMGLRGSTVTIMGRKTRGKRGKEVVSTSSAATSAGSDIHHTHSGQASTASQPVLPIQQAVPPDRQSFDADIHPIKETEWDWLHSFLHP
jgi:hypothetical protein